MEGVSLSALNARFCGNEVCGREEVVQLGAADGSLVRLPEGYRKLHKTLRNKRQSLFFFFVMRKSTLNSAILA